MDAKAIATIIGIKGLRVFLGNDGKSLLFFLKKQTSELHLMSITLSDTLDSVKNTSWTKSNPQTIDACKTIESLVTQRVKTEPFQRALSSKTQIADGIVAYRYDIGAGLVKTTVSGFGFGYIDEDGYMATRHSVSMALIINKTRNYLLSEFDRVLGDANEKMVGSIKRIAKNLDRISKTEKIDAIEKYNIDEATRFLHATLAEFKKIKKDSDTIKETVASIYKEAMDNSVRVDECKKRGFKKASFANMAASATMVDNVSSPMLFTYKCPNCGMWHLTKKAMTANEMNRASKKK